MSKRLKGAEFEKVVRIKRGLTCYGAILLRGYKVMGVTTGG